MISVVHYVLLEQPGPQSGGSGSVQDKDDVQYVSAGA